MLASTRYCENNLLRRMLLALSTTGLLFPAGLPAQIQSTTPTASNLFTALQWRAIGPAVMGGRLDAVAGVPDQPNIIYLGHFLRRSIQVD